MIVLLHCRYGGQYSGFSSPTHFTGYPVAVSGTNTPPAAQQQIFTPPQQQQGQEAASLGPSVRQTVEEEVRGRLREEIGRRQAETEELIKVGEKLSQGHSRLSLVMSRLQQELAETEASVELISQNNQQMRSDREKFAENITNLDCDEAVTASAPLYNQLIEGEQETSHLSLSPLINHCLSAHAEDAAIEDAVYFLGESLRRGIIDSEIFLKHVRNLSR